MWRKEGKYPWGPPVTEWYDALISEGIFDRLELLHLFGYSPHMPQLWQDEGDQA